MDRIERRREHIRTVSIYGEVRSLHCYDIYDPKFSDQVWDMVEERSLQLAPPPGVAALDPLMQLQQNLAALNQVNQAIGERCQTLIIMCSCVIYFQRPTL